MELSYAGLCGLSQYLEKLDNHLRMEIIDNEKYFIDVYYLKDGKRSWLIGLETGDNCRCYHVSYKMPKLELKILKHFNEEYLKINNYDYVISKFDNHKKDENISYPSRYQTKSGKQVLDLLKEDLLSDSEYIGFLKGNFYKYIYRYQRKNGKEDLEKAQFYLEELKNYEYKD